MNATLKRHTVLTAAFFCGLVFFLSPALGQVSIIPLVQESTINRGGKTRFNLQIANRGTEPLTFVMRAYGLAITVEGVPGARTDKPENSCADWITFTPETFELAPGDVQIVDGIAHAPKDAVGGYSAFITSEFRVPSEPFTLDEEEKLQAQINLGRAVSSVLLVTARSSKNFVQLRPDSLYLLSGQGPASKAQTVFARSERHNGWQASLLIENTGNIHALATGELSIWRENARLVERAPLTAGRGFVLPGKMRLFAATGEKPLADGIYMAKVQIRTSQGRLVQGTFPYSIVNGETHSGAASDAIRELLRASTPVFSLSKRMLDYKVTASGKRTQGIMIKNYGLDTLTVTPHATEWALDDDGKVVLRPDESLLVRPCDSWLSIAPNPIVIPPNRSRSVKVTVRAPAELDGEYYAAVLFESQKPSHDLPTELELPRALLITASTPRDLRYEAEIQSFHCKPVSPLMRLFIVNAVNTGNVHCFASGRVEIYDLKFNMMMEPIPFGGPSDYILPDRVRGYAVPCPGALDPGTYEAVVMLDYHDGVEPLVSRIRFNATAD